MSNPNGLSPRQPRGPHTRRTRPRRLTRANSQPNRLLPPRSSCTLQSPDVRSPYTNTRVRPLRVPQHSHRLKSSRGFWQLGYVELLGTLVWQIPFSIAATCEKSEPSQPTQQEQIVGYAHSWRFPGLSSMGTLSLGTLAIRIVQREQNFRCRFGGHPDATSLMRSVTTGLNL